MHVASTTWHCGQRFEGGTQRHPPFARTQMSAKSGRVAQAAQIPLAYIQVAVHVHASVALAARSPPKQ